MVQVPPLRQRREDIGLLVRHFLQLFAVEMGIESPEISPPALALLEGYGFPGNVRELKNLIERALLESRGAQILPAHLHFVRPGSMSLPEAGPLFPAELSPTFEAAERWVVARVQEQTGGNLAETARWLGVSRNRTYRILKETGEKGSTIFSMGQKGLFSLGEEGLKT